MNKLTFYDVLTRAKKKDTVYNFLHKQFTRLPRFGWVKQCNQVFKLDLPEGVAKLEISKGCFPDSVKLRYVASKDNMTIIANNQKQYETALFDIESKMMSELSNYLKDKKVPLTEGDFYEK